MIARGRVRDGVVVLDEGVSLPEGTAVTVVTELASPSGCSTSDERMSEEERRRVLEIMNRIAALPDENPGDTFSGADHDKVLYGKP